MWVFYGYLLAEKFDNENYLSYEKLRVNCEIIDILEYFIIVICHARPY